MSDEAIDLIVKLLNRDPKQRLGAGPTDSDEIKIHPFFKDINWDDAMQRRLKPPKPLIKPIVETGINFETLTDPEFDDEEGYMNK